MQAVILSGGFGTRLAHIVQDVPKPMAKIKDIPFLDYIIRILKSQGFDSFLFLTGYKSEIIEDYFKDLENAIFIKEEKPLGTGGAILNALDRLCDEFFVINGDTFFDIDYSLITDFAKNKNSSCTIALRYSNNVSRYGFVEINDEYKITSFIEKGNLPDDRVDGYINGGIYYIKKSLLEIFANNFNNEFISFETQILPKLIEEGNLYGLPVGGCFIDIGIPSDYFKAQELIPNWINKTLKPALFIDKDGTLIKNTQYPHGKDFEIITSIIHIVKKYSDKNFYIVMITNQAGIAKNKFNFEQMQEGLKGIKDFYKSQNINFDDIQFCPYHIDGTISEYAKKSLLRKPDAGMILRACEINKINLKESIMIGDNPSIDKIKLPYLNCEIIDNEEE